MTGLEAALAVADTLTELSIPFMFVGSFAYNQYGLPRSTMDADFVVELGSRSVAEIARRLGPPFRLDPQVSFEGVTGTTRHELFVDEIPFHIELFNLSADPYDQERFRRRRFIEVFGRPFPFLTPEDVILSKLRWGRMKDREDIQHVIRAQGNALDWDYLHAWCDRHGTRALLDDLRRSVPPI